MRTRLEPSVRSRVLKIVASAGAVLLCASVALAGPVKIIEASASGQVFSRAQCSLTQFCQETHAAGTSTVIGRFDAVLLDVVNFDDGTFTGTGVFTTPDGSTIRTEYTGVVGPPDNGVSSFIEVHNVVAGTGKYEHAIGEITVTGTMDAALRIEIVATGTLSK